MKRRAAILALATVLFAPCLFAGKPPDPLLKRTFEAVCSFCGATNQLKPLLVQDTPGQVITANATVRHVTLTFKCPEKRCRKKFEQNADVPMPPARPKATLLRTDILPPVPSR